MRRLLPFILTGFIAASLAIYEFGSSGILAYARTLDYRNRLEANVENLAAMNGRLSAELESLRSSPERAEVLARELGLYKQSDRVIKLEGAIDKGSFFEVGDLLKPGRKPPSRDPLLKASGVGLAALLFTLSLLKGRRRKKADNDRHRRK